MYLDLLGKGGTEHHGLSDAFGWHCILLHNSSDLWLETHVQHAVSLIQDQVAVERHPFNYRNKTPQTSTKANTPLFDDMQICQPNRCVCLDI